MPCVIHKVGRCGRGLALLLLFMAFSVRSFAFSWSPVGAQDRPDLTLRPAAPFAIAAGDPNRIQKLRLGADQSKDRWIRGFQFLPGDPRVVVSAFFYVEKTGQWLGAWGPGEAITEFPETVAAFLPAGSNIVVEINYRSVDVDVQDLSSLGLFFADKKPLRPLTAVGVESRVEVPSTGERVQLQKEFTIIDDSYALALRPEMKKFGQSFEVSAVDAAGSSQVLLVVKNYNPEVQNAYTFDQPVFIAKGTRIVATGYYLNDSSLLGEDVFKLTMNLFPSDEYRLTSYDAPVRPSKAKARAAKKPPPPRKTSAKKRPVQKKP